MGRRIIGYTHRGGAMRITLTKDQTQLLMEILSDSLWDTPKEQRDEVLALQGEIIESYEASYSV